MAEENIFLFYPNLIGFARIILALASFAVIDVYPALAAFLYFLSAFLDAFDGYAARSFNQSTRFGAMLDQLTDRCAFLALLMALCRFYPLLTFPLQLVGVVDIAAHWLYLHATDLTRAVTHKSSDNLILNFYYTSKSFLFFMCFGNEAFFGLLYFNVFWSGPSIFGITLIKIFITLFLPVALLKSAISVLHMIEAGKLVANYDIAQRRTNAVLNYSNKNQ